MIGLHRIPHLERYFRHPESKSGPPNGIGLLERRQVHVVEHLFIGKESNAIRDDIAEESGDILPSDEPVAYVRAGWAQTVAKVGVPKLSAMTGILRRTLYDLVKKRAVPNRSNRGKLLAAIAELSPSAGWVGIRSIFQATAVGLLYLPTTGFSLSN